MDLEKLIEKYIGEGIQSWPHRPRQFNPEKGEKGANKATKLVTLKFNISTADKLDEIDSLLVRGGVTGNPDFNNLSITINRKDLKKAEKILKGTIYKYKK